MIDRVGRILVPIVSEALHVLSAAGLVPRVEPADRQARFEGARRLVADVDRAVGESPAPTACDGHGFSAQEAEVINWGPCPHCSTAHSS